MLQPTVSNNLVKISFTISHISTRVLLGNWLRVTTTRIWWEKHTKT